MGFVSELEARGLIDQVSDRGLAKILDAGPVSGYAGFDPTAPSLHVGSLMPILGLMRLQRAGHRPIALVGGATGLVGDPSGKAEERRLLSREEISANVDGVRRQLERFLDFSGPHAARLVNNADWFAEVRYLDFLRDVGKHFSLGAMLGKESVRERLGREQGISYTEFSYMLVQAYDFLHLYQAEGCTLQLGGSDQWGNITAGIELIRRKLQRPAYGLTLPLITTADGKKFGKSETGNVWLDAARTSPYDMFQFFLNTDDRDVGRFLRFFTFLPIEEIVELERVSAADPGSRAAQRVLGREVTALVHGRDEVAAAEKRAAALFDAKGGGAVEPNSRRPRAELEPGLPLARLLAELKLSSSVSGGRRDIAGKGIYVNDARVDNIDRVVTLADLRDGKFLVLRKGKKSYHVVEYE